MVALTNPQVDPKFFLNEKRFGFEYFLLGHILVLLIW